MLGFFQSYMALQPTRPYALPITMYHKSQPTGSYPEPVQYGPNTTFKGSVVSELIMNHNRPDIKPVGILGMKRGNI
jgi:hypothetical protein